MRIPDRALAFCFVALVVPAKAVAADSCGRAPVCDKDNPRYKWQGLGDQYLVRLKSDMKDWCLCKRQTDSGWRWAPDSSGNERCWYDKNPSIDPCTASTAASGTTEYDPKQMKFVERAVEEYVQTGEVSQWTGGMAGFELGVAFHESMKRNAAIAAEKKRVEEMRRAEEERQRRIRDEQEHEARIARLAPLMKMSTESDVDLKLESASNTMSMKFDGSDSSLEYRSNAEHVARDHSNEFFSNCGRFDVPPAEWYPPYRSVEQLRRGVFFLRRTLPTLYSSADVRHVVEEGATIARGCQPKAVMPDESIALPANALDVMESLALERRAATEASAHATREHDTARERYETLVATRDGLRSETDVDRKRLADSLEPAVKAAAANVETKKKAMDEASRRASFAASREGSALVTLALRENDDPGKPVALCAEEQAVVDRMKKGLATQATARARAEALLVSSDKESRAAWTKVRTTMKEKTVLAIAKQVEKEAGRYIDVVERAHGIADARDIARKVATDPARRRNRELMERTQDLRQIRDDFRKILEDLEKAGKAALAGQEYGIELATKSHSLAEKMALLNEKLEESGLWSEAGETIAGYLGPLGESAFKAGELSIELTAAAGHVWVADRDLEIARDNARIMREQWQRTTSMIAEKEQRLRDVRAKNGCLPAFRAESCPEEQWALLGIAATDVTRLKKYAKARGRAVILRAPNEKSLKYHTKNGTRPKTAELKDAKSDVRTGLVKWVDPSKPIPDGYRVDGNGYVHDAKTNAVFYSDYDLQGVYSGTRLVRMTEGELAPLNEAVHGGPVLKANRLFQHSANDEFVENGKPQRLPGCDEEFLVIEPDCSDHYVTNAYELRAYYAAKGRAWIYPSCMKDGKPVPMDSR